MRNPSSIAVRKDVIDLGLLSCLVRFSLLRRYLEGSVYFELQN